MEPTAEHGNEAHDPTVDDELATVEIDPQAGSGGARLKGLMAVALIAVLLAGGLALVLRSGDGEGDAADENADADTAQTDDGEGDGDDVDEPEGGEADDADVEQMQEEEGDASSDDRGVDMIETASVVGDYYGGEAPVAFRDGFVSISSVFVPSTVTMEDLVPDIGDRFPSEITDALEAAGYTIGDQGSINEATAVLQEAGLLDLATEIVTGDPELMEAYTSVLNGGTHEQVIEFSADGLEWERIDFDLPIPEGAWPQVTGNGDQLVVFVSDNGWSPTGERVASTMSVHVTEDLETWSSVDIPIETPDVPDYVQADTHLDQIAVGPNGWFATVSSYSYVDLWSILPERIQNGGNGWNPTPDGIRIEEWDHDAMAEAELAAAESGDYEALEEWQPTVVEVIPWSELPLTYDEYMASQSVENNQRTLWQGTFDGTLSEGTAPDGLDWFQLAATSEGILAWGQLYTPSDVTLTDLIPDLAERFPQEIIDAFEAAGATAETSTLDESMALLAEAGLLDVATQVVQNDPELLDAYMQVSSGGTYEMVAFFSTDGSAWTRAELPSADWVNTIVAVENGLLATAGSETGETVAYVGDARGRNWERSEMPDVGTVYFYLDGRSSSGEGIATIIDRSQHYGPEYVAWTSTMTVDGYELTLSADGEGNQSLLIVEVDTGTVVRDVTIQQYSEELWIWNDTTIDFQNDDGDTILSIPMEDAEQFLWQAESDAWNAWHEANPYQPDLVLIATRDGRDWTVMDIPVDAGEWYGGAAAINDGVVVFRTADGWNRLVLG